MFATVFVINKNRPFCDGLPLYIITFEFFRLLVSTTSMVFPLPQSLGIRQYEMDPSLCHLHELANAFSIVELPMISIARVVATLHLLFVKLMA